jgi:hypothetical protein
VACVVVLFRLALSSRPFDIFEISSLLFYALCLFSGTLPGGSNRVLRGEVNFQTNGDNSSLVEANSSSNSSSSSDVEATLPRKIPEVVTARSGVGVLPQETTFFSCLSVRALTNQSYFSRHLS